MESSIDTQAFHYQNALPKTYLYSIQILLSFCLYASSSINSYFVLFLRLNLCKYLQQVKVSHTINRFYLEPFPQASYFS